VLDVAAITAEWEADRSGNENEVRETIRNVREVNQEDAEQTAGQTAAAAEEGEEEASSGGTSWTIVSKSEAVGEVTALVAAEAASPPASRTCAFLEDRKPPTTAQSSTARGVGAGQPTSPLLLTPSYSAAATGVYSTSSSTTPLPPLNSAVQQLRSRNGKTAEEKEEEKGESVAEQTAAPTSAATTAATALPPAKSEALSHVAVDPRAGSGAVDANDQVVPEVSASYHPFA
jgi:hypothetical protein